MYRLREKVEKEQVGNEILTQYAPRRKAKVVLIWPDGFTDTTACMKPALRSRA